MLFESISEFASFIGARSKVMFASQTMFSSAQFKAAAEQGTSVIIQCVDPNQKLTHIKAEVACDFFLNFGPDGKAKGVYTNSAGLRLEFAVSFYGGFYK